MSEPDALNPAASFCEHVAVLQQRGELASISEPMLRDVLTAAVKAYAAKVEAAGAEFPPVDTAQVNATEGVIAVCALIRAIDLNMFDVNMWYNRTGGGRG